MTYGRGRAEQFRLHPTFGSALNLVPPLFCLYLLALVVFEAFVAGGSRTSFGRWAAAPLGIYGLAIVLQTVASMSRRGVGRSLLAVPLLVATHVLYGLGFWRGLFTALRRPADQPAPAVTLETIRLAP